VSSSSIKEIAGVITKKSLSAHQIASYLVQQRRTRDLAAIMREVARIRSEQGVVEAEAISAQPLSSGAEQAITKLLLNMHKGAKKVILNTTENPEVTGGIKIISDGLELDNSVHGRLNRLRQLTPERK